MSVLTWVLLLIAFVLMLLAFWMFRQSQEKYLRERMMNYFSAVLPYGTTAGSTGAGEQNFWHGLLMRASIYAGFELKKIHLVLIPMAFVFSGVLGWMAYGLLGAILVFGTVTFIFGFILPYSRLRSRQAETIAQIPLFIDQVLRSLSTGRSLESAVRFAAEESRLPLRAVLDRVIRAADLGADFVESLNEAARLHQLRELNLIALAMRISYNHGSSPRDMLESVVTMVRQQEMARRELASMTGETRMTAWVLGLTPVAIALYIMVMNPNYLNILLQDAAGRIMMVVAVVLQGMGAFVLWRMLRSV